MSWWADPAFSDVLAGGYLGLVLLLWGGLFLGVPVWGRSWRLARRTALPPQTPWLSICIPARNEAENIGPCIAAALAARWPLLEVILVDDRSTDGTADAALAASGGDERLRIISGTEPRPGWAGKNWACARAAGEARGELLLFIDADVCIDPDAPAALISTLQEERLGLLSIFGTWDVQGFWERAVIPAVGWLIRGAVDLDRVNDPGRSEAFANGQLILVHREAYDQIGGHEAVRDQILDDVRLAEAFKRHGSRIGLRLGEWVFRVRLYRSLSEIIAGYSKNLYEGMGRQPVIGLGAILFILVGTLVPFLGLFLGVVARVGLGWGMPKTGWLVALALICLLQLGFRYRIDRRDGRSGRDAWTHPLANTVLIWILFRSVFFVQTKWKGRTFVDGRAS